MYARSTFYINFKIKDEINSISPKLKYRLPLIIDLPFFYHLHEFVKDRRFEECMRAWPLSHESDACGELVYSGPHQVLSNEQYTTRHQSQDSRNLCRIFCKSENEHKFMQLKTDFDIKLNSKFELLFIFEFYVLRFIEVFISQENSASFINFPEKILSPESKSIDININYDFVSLDQKSIRKNELFQRDFQTHSQFFKKAFQINFEESYSEGFKNTKDKFFENCDLFKNLLDIMLSKEKKSDPLKSVLSFETSDTKVSFFEEGDQVDENKKKANKIREIINMESVNSAINLREIKNDNFLLLENKCLICRNERGSKMRIPDCRHVFCLKCIRNWIDFDPICPFCGKKFNEVWHFSKGYLDVIFTVQFFWKNVQIILEGI